MAKKQAHIYIYGDIYDYQGEDAPEFGMVNLRTVVDVLNNNSDAEEIFVHINSRGGDVTEGFAIYDALINSGKTIITIVEGKCASIATIVCLAGTVRKMNANSEFMIHNAWADPYSMKGFNASDYAEMAEFISEADERILNLYTSITGSDAEVIREAMDAETFMDAEEALSLGFITEINEPLKAVAYLSKKVVKKSNNKMSTKKVTAKRSAVQKKKPGLKALAARALKSLSAALAEEEVVPEEPTDVYSTALADGSEIYHSESEIAVDILVFTDPELTEQLEDGDYELEGGSTISVADGAITEITEAVEESAEEMQARLTALEEENATLKAENAVATQALNTINTRLAAMQGQHAPKKKAATVTKFARTGQQPVTKKFSLPAKGDKK